MPDPIGNRPISNSKNFRYHTSQIRGTIFLICYSILNLFQPFKAIQHNSFRDPSLLLILWILDWICLRLIQWKSFERHNKFRGRGDLQNILRIEQLALYYWTTGIFRVFLLFQKIIFVEKKILPPAKSLFKYDGNKKS